MEYEVADKLSSSAQEMVRDVVVEEVTDTLSTSGVENIVCRGGSRGGGGVEGVATPCFVGQGRQDSLASQTLPAREGLACETAPRSGPLALTCKSRCHPR